MGRTLGIAVCAAAFACAAQAQDGRPPAGAKAAPAFDLGQIDPTFTFNNASFGTGGVGLRNRRDGGINISGVGLPIKRAFAYWAVVTDGAPRPAVSNISLKRGAANGPFTNIHGTRIGTGDTPCWDGDRTTVYRGNIPLSLADGNGLYLVMLRDGANGNIGGQDPWVVSNPPLFEGVSIVLIGKGTATVAVYDSGLAGNMFQNRITYRLNAPVSVNSADQVLFHTIGADGQSGVGVKSIAATAGEVTYLNDRRIAGPGSPAAGDWNGSVAAPLPQLWDNATHDVTTAAHAGAPFLLPFAVEAPDDCLVTVANVLSIGDVATKK
jgi:hypothetical protein